MLGHRTLVVEDYLNILKRRGWMVMIPAVILAAVAFAISFRMTPVYTSQTLVLIEQQKVPENYVKPVIEADLDSRLASMKEQILSRSRLQPIIERFNLGNPKANMDDRIDSVRHAISIKPIESAIANSGGLPGFFIAFQAADPHTAQLVCREITSLFLSENLRAREESAEGTTDFLKGQLDEAKNNLDAQDAKLAQFQREHLGTLPDEQGSNMSMVTSLNSQLDAATQELGRLEQDRTMQQAMLAQQTQEVVTPSEGSHSSKPTAQPSQTQLIQLQQLQAQEADLSSRYTADYPDVVEIRRKIKDLQKEIANTIAGTPSPSGSPYVASHVDSPAVAQLRSQIRSLDMQIQQKQHAQAAVQRQLSGYQDKLESSPLIAAQYKELTRGYQQAQDFYDSLLGKINQSQMATELERRQEGEQFRVMDDANLPDAPSFPKRGVFAAGGFAVGLGLGLLLVAFLEHRDKSLRTERDIWTFTKLPTLGIVSFNGNGTVAAKQRFRLHRPSKNIKAAEESLANTGG
jgi:polysaccharide chain length determinant protein (PEP-CTERM system associated)